MCRTAALAVSRWFRRSGILLRSRAGSRLHTAARVGTMGCAHSAHHGVDSQLRGHRGSAVFDRGARRLAQAIRFLKWSVPGPSMPISYEVASEVKRSRCKSGRTRLFSHLPRPFRIGFTYDIHTGIQLRDLRDGFEKSHALVCHSMRERRTHRHQVE